MQRRTDRINWLWLAAAFAVGLLIGWIVLGWWLFPVNWTDANVKDLRQETRYQVLSLVAESYLANGDLGLAGERLQQWTPQEAIDELNAAASAYSETGRTAQAQNLQTLAAALATTLTPGTQPTVAPQPPATGSSAGSVLLLLAGLVVLGVGVGVLVYLLTSRRRDQPAASAKPPVSQPAYRIEDEFVPADEYLASPDWYPDEEPPPADEIDQDFDEDEIDFSEPPEVAPVVTTSPAAPVATPTAGKFTAFYRQGDLDYDENFMIEGQTGSGYRGECGMGIAETLDNDMASPTAMDVWLFDKGDVRTMTVVLLSDYAYGNAAMRDRLRDKGDIVLAAPGTVFHIAHKTLDLEGRIAEMAYADGAGPAKSVFKTLRVDLTVTPRD